MTDPPSRVAGIAPVTVTGTFYRHAAPNRDPFTGATAGRWGEDFPVIYLGRPIDSVVIEAYRHLVDPYDIPRTAVRPRTVYTVTVTTEKILDLTDDANLTRSGLNPADLRSEVDDYQSCWQIAHAAHHAGRHGILAPAATGTGQTLALFADRITDPERPVVIAAALWQVLPPDPRRLRILDDPDGATT